MKYLTLDLVRANRRYLNEVSEWLPRHIRQTSRYQYGVPDSVFSLLDKPINDIPIHTDVLAAIALGFETTINYLEIGVSVGKTFHCMANSLQNSTLVALDWEIPSPAMLSLLGNGCKTNKSTIRSERGSNQLYYLQGDEFEPSTWHALIGRQFDIVYSDAHHSSRALMMEYQMISDLDLLNLNKFFILWDDLSAQKGFPLNRAHARICESLRAKTTSSAFQSGIIEINGWLGQHESPHYMGFANNLNIKAVDIMTTIMKVQNSEKKAAFSKTIST